MSRIWIILVALGLALGGCGGAAGNKKTTKSALSASKQPTKKKGKNKHKKKHNKKHNKKHKKAVTVKKKKAAAAAAKVRAAALRADKGAVFGTGQVLVDGSGMKVDLVAYKHGAGLDLKAGRQGTSYLPLHSFGAKTFGKLGDVPCTAPSDGEKNAMLSTPKKGQAFTLRANQSGGIWRVRVKAAGGGEVKIEYQECK